jgi:hypothetical protein
MFEKEKGFFRSRFAAYFVLSVRSASSEPRGKRITMKT